MKIGIIYATKRNEATVEVVEWMKEAIEGLGHSVVTGKVDNFTDFACDAFIIGTAVYAFSPKRAGIVPFIKQHKAQLSPKPFSLFIVCGTEKLPPKTECPDNFLVKQLKYGFLNPDKYMRTVLRYFPNKASETAFFKGYQTEEEKINNNFENQAAAVKEWVKSCLASWNSA